MTLLTDFYPLAAAVADPRQRRWCVGAAYRLGEEVDWGWPIATVRSRIMSIPQYSGGLVAAGLDDDFALVDALVAPLAFVKDVGSAATPAAQTTLAVTVPAGGVAAGNTVVVCAASSSTRPIGSVADSKGNAYVVDKTQGDGTLGASIAHSKITTPLVSGDTITVTWLVGSTSGSMSVIEFSGGAQTMDQFAVQNGSATTAVNLGTTPVTAAAEELVVGVGAWGAAVVFTPGAGFTAIPAAISTGTLRAVRGEWKIVAATGAQNPTGTVDLANNYAGLTATYRR